MSCDHILVEYAMADWNMIAKSHSLQIGRIGQHEHELREMRALFPTPVGQWMRNNIEVPSHRGSVRAALGISCAEWSHRPAPFGPAEAAHAGQAHFRWWLKLDPASAQKNKMQYLTAKPATSQQAFLAQISIQTRHGPGLPGARPGCCK